MIDLEKVKNGDESEVGQLARSVSIWVYNIVMSYLHNIEETEEVVQDTILKTLRNIEKFNQHSSLKTWVVRIAINESKDVLKYKNRQKRSGNVISIDEQRSDGSLLVELPNYYSPDQQIESKEEIEVLFDGINQLPTNQKEALTLMKLEGLSMQEVAEILGITSKAVEGLVARAKSNLTKYLAMEGIRIYKRRKNGR